MSRHVAPGPLELPRFLFLLTISRPYAPGGWHTSCCTNAASVSETEGEPNARDAFVRLDPRPARPPRHHVFEPNRSGGTAGARRPPGRLSARLRPGPARQLHRQRNRGGARFRPQQAGAALLLALPSFHLLQRAVPG